MRKKVVKRFTYRGEPVEIIDMGSPPGIPRFWYQFDFGFADLGGNSIDEAMARAKSDIDTEKDSVVGYGFNHFY